MRTTGTNPAGGTARMRISIDDRQTFAWPRAFQSLRVDQGTLWLTQNGEDILLEPGALLDANDVGRDALFSALRGCAVIDVVVDRRDESLLARDTLRALDFNRP
jgi:hypothetical protein